MRFQIDYKEDYDNDDIEMTQIEGEKDFDFTTDEVKCLTKIQSVVDVWEAKGFTLDQGGDTEWYSITVCDPMTDAQAKELLADLEAGIV